MLNATAGMHGKLHSLCAPTRSLPAPTAMDGRRCLGIVTTRAWTNDVGGESIFLPNSLSQVHLRRQWKQAQPCPMSAPSSSSSSVPRRGGVSFRVSAPTVLFREKVDGVKLCLVVGRKGDHDGSARRDTAIAPPRQICGCSDSISRRDIEKGFPGAAAHCHHLSSKWARRVAIYLPLLAIRQLGY